MEIEPALISEHLIDIYASLPSDTLAAEESRIRGALSNLAGRLVAIEQVKEINSEYPISA